MMNNVMSVSSKIIGAIDRSKPLEKLGKAFHTSPEKALAYTAVASVVVKDGIGCYKYVTQSLNNDKIPEEKRAFVAALDLVNGIVMILSQIALFFLMRKVSTPLFNKIFKKSFGVQNQKHVTSRIRMNQAKNGEKVSRKLTINREFENVKKDTLDIFKFVAELAAATIIGKRIVVPFISTPIANSIKDKLNLGEGKKERN